jgi:hypothetical protein
MRFSSSARNLEFGVALYVRIKVPLPALPGTTRILEENKRRHQAESILL